MVLPHPSPSQTLPPHIPTHGGALLLLHHSLTATINQPARALPLIVTLQCFAGLKQQNSSWVSQNPGVGSHWDALGQHWDELGQHWDALGCCAGGRGPSKPPGAGEGPWGASKQALQLAQVHTFGVAKGIFLCPVLGGFQLHPKSSALQGEEEALCIL